MKEFNRTKIVATIGPVSSSKKVLKEMILGGVNVCRLNFSHGSHQDHLQVIKNVNEINDELKLHTAILADLCGPKLRIGTIKEGAFLQNNTEVLFDVSIQSGDEKCIPVGYKKFAEDVEIGDRILLDDGKIELTVTHTDKKTKVKAKVIHGGPLFSRKGINLPNTATSLPCLSKKDKEDLKFALENNVNWVALSFVRSPSDVVELKKLIQDSGHNTLVISKIEKPQAVLNLDAIIEESDGIMVARGDLGVEVPLQEVPLIQKKIVQKCNQASKPVIIATQMMESMITNASPTRAEVNDVANAVMDGADAVMLSGETSVGEFPVKVIETMKKIIIQTETYQGIYHIDHTICKTDKDRLITDSVCDNACKLAKSVNAKAIVTMTFSGYTAFKVSSYRPKAGIYVFTSNHKILNTLNLVWGVQCHYYDKFVSTDHTISDIKFILRKEGFVQESDLIVNIASMPINEKGKSNMLKLSYI